MRVLLDKERSSGVAVNMPACHAGDRGFDSRLDRHFKKGLVAQSVEQRTENPCVGGSIPSQATIMTSRGGAVGSSSGS